MLKTFTSGVALGFLVGFGVVSLPIDIGGPERDAASAQTVEGLPLPHVTVSEEPTTPVDSHAAPAISLAEPLRGDTRPALDIVEGVVPAAAESLRVEPVEATPPRAAAAETAAVQAQAADTAVVQAQAADTAVVQVQAAETAAVQAQAADTAVVQAQAAETGAVQAAAVETPPKPAAKSGKGARSRATASEKKKSPVARDGSPLLRVKAGQQPLRGGPTLPHDAFLISRRPVTNGQFRAFVESGYKPVDEAWQQKAESAGDAAPAVHVTWIDAQAYADWAGLRLPTEVEWRAAQAHQLFDRAPHDCWEWTSSWYDRWPGSQADDRHFGQEYRVMLRNSDPTRNFYRPDASSFDIGFRCAGDPEPSEL